MYWKESEATQRLRLKAGEPVQTVAIVYPGKWGFNAEGFARKRAVWRAEGLREVEEAKRKAEAWARRNGLG